MIKLTKTNIDQEVNKVFETMNLNTYYFTLGNGKRIPKYKELIYFVHDKFIVPTTYLSDKISDIVYNKLQKVIRRSKNEIL